MKNAKDSQPKDSQRDKADKRGKDAYAEQLAALPLALNDQRRGRLPLIRHRLDQIPERKVPPSLVQFPPLAHKPLRETFGTPPKPMAAAG